MQLTKLKLECTLPHYFREVVNVNSIIGDLHLQIVAHQRKLSFYNKNAIYLSDKDKIRYKLYQNSFLFLVSYINKMSIEANKKICLN